MAWRERERERERERFSGVENREQRDRVKERKNVKKNERRKVTFSPYIFRLFSF